LKRPVLTRLPSEFSQWLLKSIYHPVIKGSDRNHPSLHKRWVHEILSELPGSIAWQEKISWAFWWWL